MWGKALNTNNINTESPCFSNICLLSRIVEYTLPYACAVLPQLQLQKSSTAAFRTKPGVIIDKVYL